MQLRIKNEELRIIRGLKILSSLFVIENITSFPGPSAIFDCVDGWGSYCPSIVQPSFSYRLPIAQRLFSYCSSTVHQLFINCSASKFFKFIGILKYQAAYKLIVHISAESGGRD
jgi:hypothetical protein